MSENFISKYLKYGDTIFLRSTDENPKYLCARSQLNAIVNFVEIPQSSDLSFYSGNAECLLIIMPK